MRRFLCTCKYVSDQEQFGKRDYWQPPEEFEETKQGDCDDFALWTWRQLLHMGYSCRFVVGRSGRYGSGHAWVTFEDGDKTYLAEPLAGMVGPTLPRLSILQYKPRFSVAWDGKAISYYRHEPKELHASASQWFSLVVEWTLSWGRLWIHVLPRVPFRLASKLFGERRPGTSRS